MTLTLMEQVPPPVADTADHIVCCDDDTVALCGIPASGFVVDHAVVACLTCVINERDLRCPTHVRCPW